MCCMFKVVEEEDDGEPTRNGYVTFEYYKAAQIAVEDLNGTDLVGKPLHVGYALPNITKAKSKSKQDLEAFMLAHMEECEAYHVCVKNLLNEIDDCTLQRAFSEFGPILGAQVLFRLFLHGSKLSINLYNFLSIGTNIIT